MSKALLFLSAVIKRTQYHQLIDEDPTSLPNICANLIVPNINLRQRRHAVCLLIDALAQNFREEIFGILSQHLEMLLNIYQENPSQSWRAKETAAFLITSLVHCDGVDPEMTTQETMNKNTRIDLQVGFFQVICVYLINIKYFLSKLLVWWHNLKRRSIELRRLSINGLAEHTTETQMLIQSVDQNMDCLELVNLQGNLDLDNSEAAVAHPTETQMLQSVDQNMDGAACLELVNLQANLGHDLSSVLSKILQARSTSPFLSTSHFENLGM